MLTLIERLERRCDTEGDCWIWTGKRDRDGYGVIAMRENGKRRWRRVHRVAYALLRGELPAELDHRCRNRACFNPAHLEGVTHAENVARTPRRPDLDLMCPHGHPRTPENTYVNGRNRYCRICAADAARRKRARKHGDISH